MSNVLGNCQECGEMKPCDCGFGGFNAEADPTPAEALEAEDLRPWGYAPGGYVFQCIDCPESADFMDKASGDKRSRRCEIHAREARDKAALSPPDAGEVRKAPQWADDSDPIGDLAIKLAARATAIEEEEGRGEWTWREIAECAVEALAPPAAAIRKLP